MQVRFNSGTKQHISHDNLVSFMHSPIPKENKKGTDNNMLEQVNSHAKLQTRDQTFFMLEAVTGLMTNCS